MRLNKGLFRLILPALVLILIIIGVPAMVAQADPGWYNVSWSYRKEITIDNTKVTAALTYFPVLISLTSDSDLASDAQEFGQDILFTDFDGTTKLSHEIEKFDGGTGELVAWVKVPVLSSSADTVIYMYYGHDTTGDQQDATNVWDSNYKMVQHLQETTGGANAIQDSTANTNHGTDNNTPTLGATGQIDGAISFDGTNDDITVADSSSLDISGNITLEAWVKPILSTGHSRVVIKSHTSWTLPYYMYALWVHQDGLGFGLSDGADRYWGGEVKGSLSDNVTQYIAGTYDGSQQKWYINGSNVATDNLSITLGTNAENLLIGRAIDASTLFTGTIDEVRISNTARSADWLLTSYNNQNSPATFFTLGVAGAGAPTAVGGIVYPVNKAYVLLPWLFSFSVLSLAIVRGALHLRKRA